MGGVVKSVGKVVTSVLGVQQPQPSQDPILQAPPAVEPPPPMPTPDDAAVRTQQRRAVADQRRRRGRQSTILTALDNESLGG